MRRSLLILGLLLLAACSDARRFSPEAWAQEDRFQRQAFTSDLIARRLLIGKGWGEVQHMLGPGRTRGHEMCTWDVGLDEDTGAPIVLQVDFKDDVATRASVHRE
ncbi:hypothetical protein AB4059_12480 [Lysobacter sp. 2RAF19]